MYNAPCCKNKRHGITPAAREICNMTYCSDHMSRRILCQRVRGSVRALRAIWHTRMFQMETRVVADAPVNLPTSSSSTPTLYPSGIYWRLHITLSIKPFQLPADRRKLILQRLPSCPHYCGFPTTNKMQIM